MCKILVVEDERNLRRLYTEELEIEGHRVTAVGNGKEALRELENGPVDLVVLDLALPNGKGMNYSSGIDYLQRTARESIMARILIFEDEPNLSCLYLEEWESEGHEVIAIDCCGEALRTLEEMPIDLVVFGLTSLKDKDLDCLQEMRACHHGLKIIIHSAHPAFEQDFRSWCAKRSLAKSSDLAELEETINEMLAGSRDLAFAK